jgi:hypothetical protein
VWSEKLDVFVKFPPIDLVLDSVVGEVNLIVEVRQIVLACPVTHLVLVAAWSPVAVRSIAVVVLQERLVLALQVLFEDDAPDLEVKVLVSKTGFFLPKRRVETDRSRRGVVRLFPLLLAHRNLFRQDLGAERHREGEVKMPANMS